MKKSILLIAVVVASITLSSCKKDYICTYTETDPVTGATYTESVEVGGASKKDIKKVEALGYDCKVD